jgi:hypothetical protein
MSAVAAESWCRACGVRADAGDAWCCQCGVPLEPPHPGTARIGRVVPVKGRVLRRNGIALREAGGAVLVLVKGEETVQLSTAEFDAAREVEVAGPPVVGAAGRLWKAQGAHRAGTLDAKWDPTVLADAGRQHATASTGTRRGAALDALALGALDLLPGLALTATELAWYQAWAAAGAGQTGRLIGWLEQLPPEGYAARVTLLLTRAADLLGDSSLGMRAAAQLTPFAAANLDARALHAALAGPGSADPVAPLVPFAVAVEGAGGRLAQWASAIHGTTRPASPFPGGLPGAAALDAYLRFRAGAMPAAGADVLGQLPVALLDEMIDSGKVPPRLAGEPGWPGPTAAYVRCRLNPGEAGLPDLTATGFTAELARRRYLEEDAAALDALPLDDVAVRHYRALAGWRSGAFRPGLDGLRPAARLVLGQVAAAQAAVQDGADAILPGELAADPTCWPLLWHSALQGALRLPGPLAGQYPRFADWLALCGIQRLLFQSRWDDALEAGRALAARTDLEVTSDEALNMVAFAQLQLGRPASALQTLDEALGGRYTSGLLVNASIVAASQGSEAALPYLARIAGEEGDPAVRSGAVKRAVDLWKQDAASPPYPEGLRTLVRAALALPQPDELHHELVSLADMQDEAWLADTGKLYSANPSQADWARYRRTWAQAKTEKHKTELTDVAQVLADLVRQPSTPEWADRELRDFAAQLDEAVHVDFGEATALAPVIEVLVAADVLDLANRIVLAAQAVVHTAFFLAKQDACISPEYEQRTLLEAVRVYRRRQQEVPPDERDYVREQLAMCVSITGFTVRLGVIGQWEAATRQFNELVDRQRYAADYSQREAITRRKGEIIDGELVLLAKRLRGYLAALDGLPLDDRDRENKRLIAETVSEMEAEIARLRTGRR